MEIAMEFATFCNICFNKNNLQKIEQTEDLTRILMLFIENKILIKEQDIYLCLNCCEKLESYDKFKEMCFRNFIDFRIEYFELKNKFEIRNDPNMEKKLRSFIETRVNGVNDTINMDDSEDPLKTQYGISLSESKEFSENKGEGIYSNYKFPRLICKEEKIEYDDAELYIFSTKVDVDRSNDDFELPVPIEHIKLESYVEDSHGSESSNENQSTSTGPYKTDESCEPTKHLTQLKKRASVKTLNKNIGSSKKKTSNFECNICQKTFSKSSGLTGHIRTHSGEKPYTCTICNKSFTTGSSLKSHRTVHTGEKPYPCSVCEKSFSESGNLRRHELVHTGEKPHKCGVCQKSFRDISHLKLHERSHTGEKPFECSECNKRFAYRTTYKTHMLTHTGEKPYSCNVCNKSFRQSVHLREHAYTHTGVKPYTCNICNKKFRWRSVFKIHQKKSCRVNIVEEKIKHEPEKT